MYTVIRACFPWFHASLKVLKCECVDNLLRFCVDVLILVKTTPFSCNFILGNRKNSQGSGQGNRGWVITVIFLEVRKCPTASDVWVGTLSWWRNHLFFLLLVWSFAPNALPQPLQKLTVKLPFDVYIFEQPTRCSSKQSLIYLVPSHSTYFRCLPHPPRVHIL
jgi:hypothetical protein